MRAADLRLQLQMYEQMSPGTPMRMQSNAWRTGKMNILPLPGDTMEFTTDSTYETEAFYIGDSNLDDKVTFKNSFVEVDGIDHILREGIDYMVEYYDRAIFFKKPIPPGGKLKITYDPSGAFRQEKWARQKGHDDFKAGDIANLILLHQQTGEHTFSDDVMRQLAAEMVGQSIMSEQVLNFDVRDQLLPNTPLRIVKAEFKNGAIVAVASLE